MSQKLSWRVSRNKKELVITIRVDMHVVVRALLLRAGSHPQDTGIEEVAAELALRVLTPRQQQIFPLLTSGKTSKEIGSELHLSERTVKFHLGELYKRLEISGRSELMNLGKSHP